MKQDTVMQTGDKTKYKHVFVCGVAQSETSFSVVILQDWRIARASRIRGRLFNRAGVETDEVVASEHRLGFLCLNEIHHCLLRVLTSLFWEPPSAAPPLCTELLIAHPHIFMTKEKEPHFFDTDTYYNRGLDRYLRDHFRGAAGFKARGEATPLSRSGKARDRIRGDLGKDLRFVVILRDPVKRAWSHYLHQCRYGVETESFERALELEPTRLSAGDSTWTAYFRGGLYARQLRVWFEAFPREHFLVLLTEDLAERPDAVARQAFAFLDVDPDVELSPPSRANVGWTPRYPRLAAALNRPGGMMGTLKHLVPYSSRQRVRKLINRWNRRPFERAPTSTPPLRARFAGVIVTRFSPSKRSSAATLGCGDLAFLSTLVSLISWASWTSWDFHSADVNTTYDPADRLVLARVPKERVRERDAYEFLVRIEPDGTSFGHTT